MSDRLIPTNHQSPIQWGASRASRFVNIEFRFASPQLLCTPYSCAFGEVSWERCTLYIMYISSMEGLCMYFVMLWTEPQVSDDSAVRSRSSRTPRTNSVSRGSDIIMEIVSSIIPRRTEYGGIDCDHRGYHYGVLVSVLLQILGMFGQFFARYLFWPIFSICLFWTLIVFIEDDRPCLV